MTIYYEHTGGDSPTIKVWHPSNGTTVELSMDEPGTAGDTIRRALKDEMAREFQENGRTDYLFRLIWEALFEDFKEGPPP